jgi:hypothetical protein
VKPSYFGPHGKVAYFLATSAALLGGLGRKTKNRTNFADLKFVSYIHSFYYSEC